MARSIWTGSISFGLVNIPISLSSAVESHEVHFHLLHDADGARIAEKRICTADGNEVPWSHIVKGFEVAKGRTIEVTAEELDRFAPEITKTIDIEQFVDGAEIDPIYYQKTYYAEPAKSGTKAYQLLAASMTAKKQVGVGRVVLRQKQHLCAMRSVDGKIVLSTMYYPDEIRQPTRVATARGSVKERALAEQLIAHLTGPFKPQAFHDTFREKLLHYLKSKDEKPSTAHAPKTPEAPSPASQSLLDALAASLSRSPKRRAGGKTAPRARRSATQRAPSTTRRATRS